MMLVCVLSEDDVVKMVLTYRRVLFRGNDFLGIIYVFMCVLFDWDVNIESMIMDIVFVLFGIECLFFVDVLV